MKRALEPSETRRMNRHPHHHHRNSSSISSLGSISLSMEDFENDEEVEAFTSPSSRRRRISGPEHFAVSVLACSSPEINAICQRFRTSMSSSTFHIQQDTMEESKEEKDDFAMPPPFFSVASTPMKKLRSSIIECPSVPTKSKNRVSLSPNYETGTHPAFEIDTLASSLTSLQLKSPQKENTTPNVKKPSMHRRVSWDMLPPPSALEKRHRRNTAVMM